ncbi:MAG: transglutaminase-like domain-containing protein [Methanobacterium sp.]
MNVSSSSAASTNQTNISTSDKSLEPVDVAISASNYTNTSNVQTTTNTNIQNVTNTTTKVNNQMASGALVKVNGLTVAQLKSGISRVQAFYKKYHRFPKTVKFGKRKIPFATFKKNIASVNLKIVTTTTKAATKINTSSVSALAKSLTAGSTTTLAKATKIFNWVRDNINYAFYYNTKYGANGTLQHRQGNCVDTSHLLIALSRAAGITSRYVHGNCQFSSGTWYGHVWAQLYVNGKWVTADATSSRNSLGVIKNWNTATYKLLGVYTTLPF